MTAYAQFFKKSTNEQVDLKVLDQELATLVDYPYLPRQWCCQWYMWVAIELAFGHDYEWITQNIREAFAHSLTDAMLRDRLLKIVNHLQENYTHKAWLSK